MSLARLLVVDDEPANRDMLARRLVRRGFDVATAASGAEALQALAEGAWSAVLLDVMMPGMSGLETLAQIRSRWTAAELPVLMVTARDGSDDVVAALELGANDYVTKPVDLPVTLARLKTQLARKDAEDRLRASEERYALAAKGANDGLWDWDLAAGRIHVSARWTEIVGLVPEVTTVTVDDYLARVHPEDLGRVREELDAHLANRAAYFHSEHRLRHDESAYRWVLARGLAVRRPDGTPIRIAGSLSDVTSGKVVDPLTGLPNRILLHERLERMLGPQAVAARVSCAALMLDIDGFARVNDGHGRGHGDALLKSIAERLVAVLRLTDEVARPGLGAKFTVARLGGDEFVVVLHQVRDPLHAVGVAERLQRAIAPSFSVCDREVYVTVCIGIAMSSPGITPDDLLGNADTALHRARAGGVGQVAIFDDGMRAEVLERLHLDAALRGALERDEFVPHYQPIVDLKSGRLVGFEALMRWRRGDGRLVAPAAFIPTLEASGLIVPVGRRFAELVCQQMAAWRQQHPDGPSLWVNLNVASAQLADPDVLATLLTTVREAELVPEDVVVEITESMAIGDVQGAADTLRGFRAAGFRVVLDDFGTGYSSLSCLHELPIAGIKLDRAFVAAERQHPAILRAVVQLAEQLGLTVTAEGVETDRQHAQLHALGCGFAQGYLFARPLDAEQAGELIRRPTLWPLHVHERDEAAAA